MKLISLTQFKPIVRRSAIALGAALFAAAVSWSYWREPPQSYPSDFSIAWAGARELRAGGNPYDIVGPGRHWDYPFPLLYPMPAVVAALPFSWFPIRFADPLFVGVSTGLFVWAVTRHTVVSHRLVAILSMPFITAVQVSQWSPILCAATLLPGWGFLLATKPTIGAALWVAYPSRSGLIGAAVFTVGTVLIWPWWVEAWWGTLASAPHVVAPITRWGGPVLLLALVKWRLSEARLLAALACVPQTAVLYEAVPLFLIPRSVPEALVLLMLSLAVLLLRNLGRPYGGYDAELAVSGHLIIWLLYIPCLVMILRRPANPAPVAR